jgi:hypothetical protein
VYGHLGDIVAANLDLADVQSDPHLDAERPNGVADGARTLNAPSCPSKAARRPSPAAYQAPEGPAGAIRCGSTGSTSRRT